MAIPFIGLFIVLVFWGIIPTPLNMQSTDEEKEYNLENLWQEQAYRQIIEYTEEHLNKDPLSYKDLVYRGFSLFYEALLQMEVEDKLEMLETSIINLRRALLVENEDLRPQIQYILGKAYFHRGKFYTDLAIEYLEKAKSNGYTAKDIDEYLGLSYSQIEDYPKSVEHFQKALRRRPSDLLHLTLAQTFFKMQELNKAEEHLVKSIEMTGDPELKKKARFLLGDIYQESGAYEKAETQYLRIIEADNKSADAHFYLGEIYQQTGEDVKARAQWRATLRIDPSHYGARLRLYN